MKWTYLQIDFGDGKEANFSGLDLNGAIDFGDVNLQEEGEIDWGDVNVEHIAEGEIDYNISLESGIVVEADGHDGGVATGNEALTVLDNPSTRNEFIDQLFEVSKLFSIILILFKFSIIFSQFWVFYFPKTILILS